MKKLEPGNVRERYSTPTDPRANERNWQREVALPGAMVVSMMRGKRPEFPWGVGHGRVVLQMYIATDGKIFSSVTDSLPGKIGNKICEVSIGDRSCRAQGRRKIKRIIVIRPR